MLARVKSDFGLDKSPGDRFRVLLDGRDRGGGQRRGGLTPTFHRAPRPTRAELTKLLHTIGRRVARLLERLGPLARDADSDHLDFEPGEAFDRLVGASSEPLRSDLLAKRRNLMNAWAQFVTGTPEDVLNFDDRVRQGTA